MKIDMALDVAKKVEERLPQFAPEGSELEGEYRYLLMMAEMMGGKEELRYKNYYDLVLDLAGPARKHRATDLPDGIGVMEAKECFYNSCILALENDDLFYVEGYAQGFGLFVDHAWVEDSEGRIIDPTWAGIDGKDEESVYIGVKWSKEAYAKHAVRAGSWPSVFHTDRMSRSCQMLREGLRVENGFVV